MDETESRVSTIKAAEPAIPCIIPTNNALIENCWVCVLMLDIILCMRVKVQMGSSIWMIMHVKMNSFLDNIFYNGSAHEHQHATDKKF